MSNPPVSTHETLRFPLHVGNAVEVYRDPYTVIRKQAADFGDFQKEYFLWDRGVRAAVIPLRGSEVLFTRQFRFLANRITLELPGGKVEPGEDPADAAIRECFEETGVACRSLQHLLHYHPGLDTYHNPTTVFYSTDLEICEPAADTETSRWMSLEEAVTGVFHGTINDSLSIIGILGLHHLLHRKT